MCFFSCRKFRRLGSYHRNRRGCDRPGEGTVTQDVGAGLYTIGIPKDSILKYETALKADHFVVVAHGTLDEVTTAKRILEKTGPLSIDEHHASS